MRFPWTWTCRQVFMDKYARLTHGFHGWHTKAPWMMRWWRKKKKLIGKRELIVVRSSQRGNNSHKRRRLLDI